MEFSIDLASERIYDARTREIFEEVRQSFAGGNYRSAIVMLWTVVVCDLLYKLQELRDLYSDETATKILQDVAARQKTNPKSPEWEIQLVKAIADRTQLLDVAEFQEVLNAQGYRNLSAHPVLGTDELLYTPSKETVRACIRNMLEAVLLKPPLLSKKIVDNFVEDLAAKRDLFVDDTGLRKYLEAKYLRNLKPQIENSLFQTLWKFTFNLANPEADANRQVNFRALSVLYQRRPHDIETHISENQAYFSQVAAGYPLDYLIRFLSLHLRLFKLLTDAAKMPIVAATDKDIDQFAVAWFLSGSVSEHLNRVRDRCINTDQAISTQTYFKLRYVAEEENCISELVNLGITLYGLSGSFDSANMRFAACIYPFLETLSEAQCLDLLRAFEDNSQINSEWRNSSRREARLIREACKRALGDSFDFSQYSTFEGRCKEKT